MTSFLLDTNAISEMTKPTPNNGYIKWLATIDEPNLYTSCLVIGELAHGIARLYNSKKRKEYEEYLQIVIMTFGERALSVDIQTSHYWGEMSAEALSRGAPSPAIDTLIAAQCIQHDMTLVTRNVKDFKQFSELKIYNPWDEE